MIQRRQSLEWLLAAAAFAVSAILHGGEIKMFYALYLPAALTFITIFLFKNRSLQIKLCKWNIILSVVAWLMLIIQMVSIDRASDFFTMIRPAVPIFLIWMGMKNTMKDEEKVRSIDRIR
jgi:hypothetical protein